MKPLKFGDLQSKSEAIEEYRNRTNFEDKVRQAMQVLARLQTLPPLDGSKLRDYPPVAMRFSIHVLEEANRRERARREGSGK